MEAPRGSADGMRLRWELTTLAGIGALFLLVCVWLIARGAPLGHDEAVYALKARTLAEGSSSAFFWNDYRAPGLPSVLAVLARSGGSDAVMRLGVVAFGGLSVAATWLIGRSVFDKQIGLIAASGVAFTPVFLASSSSVWPDIPGTAAGLVVLAVLLLSVQDERVSWWVLLAAPLSVAATIIRFGAPIPIGIGALAIAIWKWPALRNSLPQLAALAVITGAGVGSVLAFPAVLGTVMSPLEAIGSLGDSNNFPIYKGFVDYAKLYDFLLVTPTGLFLILGLVLGVGALFRSRSHRAPFAAMAGIGVVTAVVLAATLHGEYRYLAPAYPWLWIAGAYGLATGLRAMPRQFVKPVVGVAILVTVLAGTSDGAMEVDSNKERFPDIRTAALELDAATADGQCGVVTGYVPQVAWYSKCTTTRYDTDSVRLSSDSFPSDPTVFIFLVQDGKRQPEGVTLIAYLDRVEGPCIESGAPDDGPLRHALACPVLAP